MQDINTRLYLDVINNLYSKKVLKLFMAHWFTQTIFPTAMQKVAQHNDFKEEKRWSLGVVKFYWKSFTYAYLAY